MSAISEKQLRRFYFPAWNALQERVTILESEVELLKGKRLILPTPAERLLVAAEKTAAVLREWRAAKADMLENPLYDDYADVVSTLPLLEEALAAVERWNCRDSRNAQRARK